MVGKTRLSKLYLHHDTDHDPRGDIPQSTPLPELERLHITIAYLAAITADVMGANPAAPIDLVQDRVQRHIHTHRQAPAQWRTIDLAVEFGCHLAAVLGAHVIRDISHQFLAMDPVPYNALALFIVHLHHWNNHLLLHRAAPPRVDDDVITVTSSDVEPNSEEEVRDVDSGIHFGGSDIQSDMQSD